MSENRSPEKLICAFKIAWSYTSVDVIDDCIVNTGQTVCPAGTKCVDNINSFSCIAGNTCPVATTSSLPRSLYLFFICISPVCKVLSAF